MAEQVDAFNLGGRVNSEKLKVCKVTEIQILTYGYYKHPIFQKNRDKTLNLNLSFFKK